MVDFATGTIAGLTQMLKKASKFKAEELDALLSGSGYSPAGLPVLRQALAGWDTETGLPTGEDEILITTGAQQAMTLATQLFTTRGDLVALDNPSFLGAIDIFKACGTRVEGIPFSNTASGIDLLEKRLRATLPRLLYLMPTFQNPTGYVIPTVQRRQLADLSEELQLPVIEDHTLSYFELKGGRASELAQLALRNGVMLMPGENLSVDGSYFNYLRLPFFLDPLYLAEGIERLATTWDSYKDGLK